MQLLKRISIFIAACGTIALITLGIWLLQLSSKIDRKVKDGWFLPPVEIYSTPDPLFKAQQTSIERLSLIFTGAGYEKRSADQRLISGTFSVWPLEKCQQHISFELDSEVSNCIILKTKKKDFGPRRQTQLQMVLLKSNSEIIHLLEGEPLKQTETLTLSPHLFAQFYGNKPILKKITPLSDIPLYCLQSITAIEDNRYLEHQGISPVGILRAAVTNIIGGRRAQGGSTITQQLVKNYFLTPERTYKRKFIEIFMSLLLELKFDKDTILEIYLNVIYMGQNGPFEVRGYGAAADHYFKKNLSDLNLSECALLAAIVNSPGRFNPFHHPERALTRRNRVLSKLKKYEMVDDRSLSAAKAQPLPTKPVKTLSDPAPYFVDAIQNKLKSLNIDDSNGLRVFTTLREQAQEAAQQAIKNGLKELEERSKVIQNLKKSNHHLESLLLSVHIPTGEIIALVGGRNYRQTQYNRALFSHRQVGSLMKPFVYLAALETIDENGNNYHPLSAIDDSKFTYKYEGQRWTPKNYDHKFQGLMPLFYALKNSINVPTARLGIKIGLTSIVDLAQRVGIESKILPLPSLSLGSFELFPWELTRAYSTIARMGVLKDNHYIKQVEDLSGTVIYKEPSLPKTVIAPQAAAVLIGMLKQTVATGTARSLPSWRGFKHPTAGKTGTTSNTKDAWFVGFTPEILTLVWVGYDSNQSHKLTGASGAIPIWAKFMKKYAAQFPIKDFQWPEGTVKHTIEATQLRDTIQQINDHEAVSTELIFRSENAPE